MGHKIEIFTAGCPVCDPAVELVKNVSLDTDKIVVYDLGIETNLEENKLKIKQYRIQQVPSVVVDGKLLDCCRNGITKEELLKAGVGN